MIFYNITGRWVVVPALAPKTLAVYYDQIGGGSFIMFVVIIHYQYRSIIDMDQIVHVSLHVFPIDERSIFINHHQVSQK